MSDFSQNGIISTLHDFGTKSLDEIPIKNLIISNKPSPEGWADVIKMALVKINKN